MENGDDGIILADRYKKTLDKLHQIMEKAVDELAELQAVGGEMNEQQRARWDYVFGSRESVVSATVKITGIIVKLITMEKKIMTKTKESTENKVQELSEYDLEIIRRYHDKIGIGGEEVEVEEKGAKT